MQPRPFLIDYIYLVLGNDCGIVGKVVITT